MANLLEVLGVSPDDIGSVPQDIKDASSLLEGMQDIYEEMPLSKRKEEFAIVISEGVKQLLIRLGALTRLGVQSTKNIQQQLPETKNYNGSLYVRTSIMDDYKEPFYTIYGVNSDFTFPNGARTINSIYYKRNDSVQYFATDTIEEFEDIFATNEMTLLPFKMGNVLKLEKSINTQVKPSGDIYTYISINGYSEKGFNITFWAEGVNDNIITIIEDKTNFSIFENFGTYVKDMNIVQYLTKYTNSGNFVLVDNVKVPSNQNITPTPPTPPTPKSTPTPPNKPTPPPSTPTPPTPPSKPTPPPSKPTPPTSTPTPPKDEPKEMTKQEIKNAIKGLNILAKLGDNEAKESIKGLKILLKYAN
jgi:hypothetical protein